jgi:hypothetical protein
MTATNAVNTLTRGAGFGLGIAIIARTRQRNLDLAVEKPEVRRQIRKTEGLDSACVCASARCSVVIVTSLRQTLGGR